ncbi:MAG: glycosyltransferase family 2 protein [Nitrospira sp.]|nr:glycosyltransferase family 2 protein [Nitrospira sp.]
MLSIAVIIANRNNARFLPQCLDSVLSQTLRPAEVVVIDDASTDNSREIICDYARNRNITPIFNETPLGVAASRHKAIEQSVSEYLTTLDADDFYQSSQKLAEEARVIMEHPSVGRIAFSDVMRVGVHGEPLFLVSSQKPIREGNLSFFLRHLRGFIPRDYLVSRVDYLAAGGFNPALRFYEDWELKIRLSQRCTWHYSGVIGTAYRDNPRGLSKAPLREHYKAQRKIFAMHCDTRHPIRRGIDRARFFLYQCICMRRLAI